MSAPLNYPVQSPPRRWRGSPAQGSLPGHHPCCAPLLGLAPPPPLLLNPCKAHLPHSPCGGVWSLKQTPRWADPCLATADSCPPSIAQCPRHTKSLTQAPWNGCENHRGGFPTSELLSSPFLRHWFLFGFHEGALPKLALDAYAPSSPPSTPFSHLQAQ